MSLNLCQLCLHPFVIDDLIVPRFLNLVIFVHFPYKHEACKLIEEDLAHFISFPLYFFRHIVDLAIGRSHSNFSLAGSFQEDLLVPEHLVLSKCAKLE